MYRIGFPFWKQAARMGAPLTLRINVIHDDEAGVFVATSDDLKGLVCEAASMDDLVKEANIATHELLELQTRSIAVAQPATDFRFCATSTRP